MKKENAGWIKLHRGIRNHWVWQDSEKLKWWLDLIMECNHTDQRVNIGFELFDCRRGQTINSLQTWSTRWRTDVGRVRRFFALLKKDGMIQIENLKKTTRITVCKYDNYNDRQHDNNTQINGKRIPTEFEVNTNKNVFNNEKNEREEATSPSQALKKDNPVEYTKEELEDFRYVTEWIKENTPVVARMKEPLTIQQLNQLKKDYPGQAGFNMFRKMLIAMNNSLGIEDKNRSVDLTLRRWLKNERDPDVLDLIKKSNRIKSQMAT